MEFHLRHLMHSTFPTSFYHLLTPDPLEVSVSPDDTMVKLGKFEASLTIGGNPVPEYPDDLAANEGKPIVSVYVEVRPRAKFEIAFRLADDLTLAPATDYLAFEPTFDGYCLSHIALPALDFQNGCRRMILSDYRRVEDGRTLARRFQFGALQTYGNNWLPALWQTC